MNTATGKLIITAPGSVLPYLANMDKLTAQMRAQTQAINNAIKHSNRAFQFLVEQYAQSALAKKRQAKQNLTAACNAALVCVRRTLRELIATFIEHTTVPHLQLRELLSEHHQANAPNRCTHKRFASLRQQIQTTKAGN